MMISEMIETNAYLQAQTGGRLPDGGALATIDGTNDPLYLLNDALGSVRGVTDEAGDLAGAADYAVYGEVRASSGVSTLFQFTGEQHDTETGFTYLRARYANPSLGRFVSADTVQPNAPGTQGYNLYAYVANNPTTWTDPSGHSVDLGAAFGNWLSTPTIFAVATACAMRIEGCAGMLASATVMTRSGNRFGTIAWGLSAALILACAMDIEITHADGATQVRNRCLEQAADILDALEFGSPGPVDDPNTDPLTKKDPVSPPQRPRPRESTECDQMGTWRPENAGMSDQAWSYEFMVSSWHSERPGMRFIADGVSFDGCKRGIPMEAKGCRMDYIWTTFPGAVGTLAGQLRRQSRAANAIGAIGVTWFAAEEGARDWIAETALGQGLANITAIYYPASPPCSD